MTHPCSAAADSPPHPAWHKKFGQTSARKGNKNLQVQLNSFSRPFSPLLSDKSSAKRLVLCKAASLIDAQAVSPYKGDCGGGVQAVVPHAYAQRSQGAMTMGTFYT
jgi:hypothetical protein